MTLLFVENDAQGLGVTLKTKYWHIRNTKRKSINDHTFYDSLFNNCIQGYGKKNHFYFVVIVSEYRECYFFIQLFVSI